MARILGIDYGSKKTGLAVTDPLQISVNPLDTIETKLLTEFLADYFAKESVEKIVIGEPMKLDGSPGDIHHLIVGFKRKLTSLYPEKEIVFQDERYSSKAAKEIIRKIKTKKKDRKDKKLVDKISAVLILQEHLGHHYY